MGVSKTKQISSVGSPFDNMNKVPDSKNIDDNTNNEAKPSIGINLSMAGASEDWMDTFEITDLDDSDDEEKTDPSKKVSEVSENTNKESETNISLPMTGAPEAWMDDFEAPTMDSDAETDE